MSTFQHIQPQFQQASTSVPHTRPETPRSVTHNHDEDYSDEDSDPDSENAGARRFAKTTNDEEDEA